MAAAAPNVTCSTRSSKSTLTIRSKSPVEQEEELSSTFARVAGWFEQANRGSAWCCVTMTGDWAADMQIADAMEVTKSIISQIPDGEMSKSQVRKFLKKNNKRLPNNLVVLHTLLNYSFNQAAVACFSARAFMMARKVVLERAKVLPLSILESPEDAGCSASDALSDPSRSARRLAECTGDYRTWAEIFSRSFTFDDGVPPLERDFSGCLIKAGNYAQKVHKIAKEGFAAQCLDECRLETDHILDMLEKLCNEPTFANQNENPIPIPDFAMKHILPGLLHLLMYAADRVVQLMKAIIALEKDQQRQQTPRMERVLNRLFCRRNSAVTPSLRAYIGCHNYCVQALEGIQTVLVSLEDVQIPLENPRVTA